MSDIIVYDKMTEDFDNFGLAVLENAYKPRVYRRLNSDYIVDFYLPQTDDKRQYLEQENIVKINGQLFLIRGVTDALADNGVLSVFVECEHISYELYTHFIESISLSDVSPNLMLAAVLDGSRFTGDATALSGTHDFTVDKENAIWGINHFLALTDAEMERDNFTITMVEQIGSDNGVSFREGKNIKSISRKVDSSGVITKLYVYGKDDVTIDPLESQYIDDYPTVKSGKVVFPDVSDLTTLQSKGEAYLAVVEVPKYTYQVKVVELKQALGWDADEAFDLGDTVHIYVESLGIEVTARVVEYEEFPKNPEESNVTFANFVPGIEDTLALLNDTRETVNNFTTGRKLNTFFLDGEINTLRNLLKASGSYASATVLDDGGFLLENTDTESADYGALYLGPGIFAIANSKDASNNWEWTTFGTGSGFTADKINTGTLQAALVKIQGDVNFYWDDTNIYVIDPNDSQKQIRIGKYDGTNYGIGFTTDGGSNWKQSLDFSGLVIGGDTTFESGYDPTTKETPTGAQAKADAAQAAATAVANAAQATADSAATAAANAQTDADTANSLLADIVSDGNLSPQEKRVTLKEWLIIAGEKSTIDDQSATYGVSVSAYDTAFTALATYLNGGSTWSSGTPSMLSDLESVIGIDGDVFRGKFKDYYDARTAILNAFTDKAKADAATAQSAADAAQADATTALANAATAQATADGKIETYYQDAEPASGMSTGDLWIDTNDGNKLYRYSGSAWVAVQDTAIQTALTNAESAQTTADGKITSFYQTTAPASGMSEGDFWIDTDDKNKLYRYTSGSWQAARDTDIAQAIANAAAAQAKADTSVQQNTLYNKVKITTGSGIEVYDASNVQRVQIADLGGSKYGIRIKNSSGDTTVETNSDGELELTGGSITITHGNGSKTVLDGTSFRAYPDAGDSSTYISVDSKGLKRVYTGIETYFRDAIATGNRTVTGTHTVYSYTAGTMNSSYIDATDTIDLIGGEWVGKTSSDIQASFAIVDYGPTPEDDPDRNYVLFKRQPEITGVTAITGGIRVAIVGGATWMYDIDHNGAGPCTDVYAEYTYLIFG